MCQLQGAVHSTELAHSNQHRGCGAGCAGLVIVRFYGEHSSMWVAPEQLSDMQLEDEDHQDRLRAIKAHPKMKHK